MIEAASIRVSQEPREDKIDKRWLEGRWRERDKKTFDLSSHKCHCRTGVYLPITSSIPVLILS